MGRSASGILFYGYAWDDVVPDPEDEDEEEPDPEDEDYERGFVTSSNWTENVLKAQGHIDPWTTAPEDEAAYPAWKAANEAAIEAWRDMNAALTQACPVDWGHQGNSDDMIPYLFVKGTETTADGHEAMAITSLDVGGNWRHELDAFLVSQGITPPEGDNQPGWWLTSFYG